MLIDDFALGWIYGRLVYRYWTIVVFSTSACFASIALPINTIIGSALVLQALQVEELPMGPLHSKWQSVGVALFLQIQILSRDIAAQLSLLPFTLHCFHDGDKKTYPNHSSCNS